MNLKQVYDNALTYDEYVHLLSDNLSLHELHYKKFSISESDQRTIAGLRACKILIITETWCGDSLALIPIIRKISEINGPIMIIAKIFAPFLFIRENLLYI